LRREAWSSISPPAARLEQRKLVAPVEFEAPWQDVGRAIDGLLGRTISGKAVLLVDRPRP
jgi:hypothetical protein